MLHVHEPTLVLKARHLHACRLIALPFAGLVHVCFNLPEPAMGWFLLGEVLALWWEFICIEPSSVCYPPPKRNSSIIIQDNSLRCPGSFSGTYTDTSVNVSFLHLAREGAQPPLAPTPTPIGCQGGPLLHLTILLPPPPPKKVYPDKPLSRLDDPIDLLPISLYMHVYAC